MIEYLAMIDRYVNDLISGSGLWVLALIEYHVLIDGRCHCLNIVY